MPLTQNRYYSNLAQGVYLTGGLSGTQATMVVTATPNWPTVFPFVASVEPGTLDEELVLVTAGAGTSGSPYNITRGFDGTTGVSHAANVAVVPKVCQLDLAEPQQHLNLTGSASGAHGLPSSAWLGGQYQLINKQVLATPVASVTFNSTVFGTIPVSASNLRVLVSARSSYTGAGIENLQMRINGYSGAFYGGNYLSFSDASATTPGINYTLQTSSVAGLLWTSLLGPTGIGRNEIELPFFNDIVWVKGFNFKVTATDGTGQSNTAMGGGGCSQITTAISSLTFTTQNAANFLTNSLFALYAY